MPKRFAITATDRYIGVLDSMVAAGWRPLKLFSAPVDDRLHHNKAVIEAALRLGIDVQLSRLGERDLEDLAARGCEVLVVASYQWRIGDWRKHLPHAINFHPSPLPEGRGPYPIVRALLEQRVRWGTSCHKIEHEFDRGDLLDEEHFEIAPRASHETLDLQVQMAMRRLAGRVAADFDTLWRDARPQGEGSYFPMWGEAERTLDFAAPVEDLLCRLRAFGRHECIARVNGITLYVQRAEGWCEAHAHAPGTMVHSNSLAMVVAAGDGYLALTGWSLVPPGQVVGGMPR